jgi:hypothetical protein
MKRISTNNKVVKTNHILCRGRSEHCNSRCHPRRPSVAGAQGTKEDTCIDTEPGESPGNNRTRGRLSASPAAGLASHRPNWVRAWQRVGPSKHKLDHRLGVPHNRATGATLPPSSTEGKPSRKKIRTPFHRILAIRDASEKRRDLRVLIPRQSAPYPRDEEVQIWIRRGILAKSRDVTCDLGKWEGAKEKIFRRNRVRVSLATLSLTIYRSVMLSRVKRCSPPMPPSKVRTKHEDMRGHSYCFTVRSGRAKLGPVSSICRAFARSNT